MPATPAWPPKSLPRLFVRAALSEGAAIALDPGQANYLGNVMRKGIGDELLLFDGASGEWLARVAGAGKKRMALSVERKTRPLEAVPDVWLAFAPVKRAQTDWMVEKATELGAARLIPVMTQRTVAERVKLERLESISIEAAEQCNRTSLPAIAEPLALAAFLKAIDRPLYFADEGGGAPVAEAMRAGPAAILVGPEGGFTDEERALVRAIPQAVAVSLGPRILRAETAALAALAAFMAVAGDWGLSTHKAKDAGAA
ncbi:16S rRNA (uracil(1498)-N(3))-methyltransferase [Sphingomonas lutea]|uniref:Ribosomal RNA small subunit methyltransferase E n=1 Tax=Sphingomonas lutea TaxID=1045317 RepID=A0A7G9SJP8_9SPHN|nr:16S rRNA (uracil(1498)-N(3))-methyltransferase [Sphingomonas lutea]QNN68073.1 16S rRNA (uracil(1498)-N(3))-methyltransferase [Sphingomonas lutea]